MTNHVVIVGGSHAAVSVADDLRKHGFDGSITLVSEEDVLPYQRPPLSKDYMSGAMSLERLKLRPESWYADQNVQVRLSSQVIGVDRTGREIATEDGTRIGYDTLVLATGAHARDLPPDVGGALENVHTMRDLADADTLTDKMVKGRRLAVIGGGYIGLEAAAGAAKRGMEVTVIEAAPRILKRVACRETADAFRALHESHGVRVLENTQIARIVDDGAGRAGGVELADGQVLPADLVIVGIGIAPNAELAEAAGLEVAVGIVVDDHGRTSDPDIYACGDCTIFDFRNMPTRLESVQNAHDQAGVVAANIMGRDMRYEPTPWFWSDQYDMKLQIAGFNRGYDRIVARPGRRAGSVSHFYFQGDTFLAVDCLNDAATYAMCRKILADKKALTPAMVADETFDLRAFAK
ncbi:MULTISPECIES: FAD-dependent oxidoreductase [unclassified Roseitalea]|uniref:NAD(P)/FAD-dependent oxidoreductase n=1 Tax=unclassified Roseitalea TaxID=2639107 RepID=UPI00273F2546|nr:MULTISPECIES: FAD-dependent oxidoreductase [unclassified Roseitalea]